MSDPVKDLFWRQGYWGQEPVSPYDARGSMPITTPYHFAMGAHLFIWGVATIVRAVEQLHTQIHEMDLRRRYPR